jgi:hypothetical protein
MYAMKIIVLFSSLVLSVSGFSQANETRPVSDSSTVRKAPGRGLIAGLGTSKMIAERDCRIALKIKVDPSGMVVGEPVILRSRTTTDDPELINEVIAMVKRDARFTEALEIQVVFLTINIKGKDTTLSPHFP